MALIITFTINSLYSGTRLGLCWLMLEERYEEYRGQVELCQRTFAKFHSARRRPLLDLR